MRSMGTFTPFQFSYPGRYYSPDGLNLVPLPDFTVMMGKPQSQIPPGVYVPACMGGMGNHCHCGGHCGQCANRGLGQMRRRARSNRRMGWLGDDLMDGGNGGGGGDYGSFSDSSSGLTPDILAQIDAGTYTPSPTDTFSQFTPGGTVPSSGTFDQYGGVNLPGGGYINSYGDQIMPDGTVYMTDGWVVNSDGSVTDPSGNNYPATTPTAQAVQQNSAARGAGSGGGASGGAKGGASSPKQTPQQAAAASSTNWTYIALAAVGGIALASVINL